jgi:threonine/homoserine/homoserine lactone efflux protein
MFIQGLLIGFTAAATLGPIALLTIQRTLKDGWRIGVTSGLGVALADGLYGLAGALGMAALTSLLVENQVVLRVTGGLVLVYLGVKASLSKIQLTDDRETPTSRNSVGAFASIFLLTLSNPMTILFFSAVFAGVSVEGVTPSGDLTARPGLFAAGVFAGSFIWWVILTSVVSALRSRFRLERLVWLNRISGMAIIGFGIWVLVETLVLR